MVVHLIRRRMVRKHFIVVAEVESRIVRKIVEGPVYSRLRNKQEIQQLEDVMMEKSSGLDVSFPADRYDVMRGRASGLDELKQQYPDLTGWEEAEYEKMEEDKKNMGMSDA